MADFYVDAVNGASGNAGTQLAPKQYISEVTMSANNRIFLRRGQVHPISGYRFLLSGMLLDSYGSGPLPVLQKTAGPDAWLYIRNADGVVVRNIDLDGNGFNGPVMAVANTAAAQAVTNFRLENLRVHGSANASGLYIAGLSGSTVRAGTIVGCEFYDNAWHGTICSTDVQGVSYIGCHSHHNASVTGGHGFSAWAPSASPAPIGIQYIGCLAEYIYDADGIEGQGFQGDDNSSYISFIGCETRFCEGYGFLFNISTNGLASGCISHDNDGPGFGCTGTATGARFYNNTSFGNALNSGSSVEMSIGGNSTGADIKNNILHGRGVTGTGLSVNAGAASGTVAAYNAIYGVTTSASGITPTNGVSADPLLDANYRISQSSPCYQAGTRVSGAALKDFYGKEITDTPDIGAMQVYAARSPKGSARTMSTKTVTTRVSSYGRAL